MSLERCRAILWDRVDARWPPRTESFAKDKQDDESIRLVEASFFHHDDAPVAVLLKVRDKGGLDRRVTLLKAIFRVSCVQLLFSWVNSDLMQK